MDKEFGMKELYDLTLKTTYPIELGDRVIEEGEVVARFDKIQLANFNEVVSHTAATGGYDNKPLVLWEKTQQVQLNFSQGIFSKTQFALLTNAALISKKQGEPLNISDSIVTESDENGEIIVGKKKISSVFIYNMKTGKKLKPKTINWAEGKILIESPYTDVRVDFEYEYVNKVDTLVIGNKLIRGYLSLEGKTRVKDDTTGKTRTGILRIPRLKLVSDLSMRLGREATPMMANFEAIGFPTGERGRSKVMEILFLDDDIDAEM